VSVAAAGGWAVALYVHEGLLVRVGWPLSFPHSAPPLPLNPPRFAVIPIHYTAYRGNTKLQADAHGNPTQLIRLTIASLPNGSPMFWLHFALIVLYNIYAMCILFWHFRRYVIIRQTYLTRGDDPNYWMALTHGADAKSISKKVKRMLLDLNLEAEAKRQVRQASLLDEGVLEQGFKNIWQHAGVL